ncbi:Uncharacterized protein DAT39_001356, partial [Clarias magur]
MALAHEMACISTFVSGVPGEIALLGAVHCPFISLSLGADLALPGTRVVTWTWMAWRSMLQCKLLLHRRY